MNRRSLLLGAAALGCSGQRRPASALATALLALSQRFGPSSSGDLDWSWSELYRISQRVATRQATREPAAKALSRVLFDDLGFVREVQSTALDFVLLPSVLQGRRGSCVGLGTVYLCVAQVLGLDAHGVLRPGHFLVQQRDPGNSCNVELLRRGELMPDAWYSERFPLNQPGSRSYGRPLSSQEVAGVAAFNVGNECRRQNQWSAAKQAYGEAVAAFPTFAEAHAGLGSIQQLLGDRGAAAESYARAVELDQTLPGIEKNLALLGIRHTAP